METIILVMFILGIVLTGLIIIENPQKRKKNNER